MKRKTRKQKMVEYEQKYSNIPLDFKERLEWLYDKLNITESKAQSILNKRDEMMMSFQYQTIEIILYEVPEGKERPRFRITSKRDLINNAANYPQFVHVYSLSGHEDHVYLNRLISGNDFVQLEQLLCTPCNIEYISYHPTPSSFSKEDIFLAELGLIRPLTKPDFDNIEKKYADMFNGEIWLDDIFVVDASIKKMYSVLPRIEMKLHFLNQVYTKSQYNNIIKRKDFTEDMKLNYFGGKQE